MLGVPNIPEGGRQVLELELWKVVCQLPGLAAVLHAFDDALVELWLHQVVAALPVLDEVLHVLEDGAVAVKAEVDVRRVGRVVAPEVDLQAALELKLADAPAKSDKSIVIWS